MYRDRVLLLQVNSSVERELYKEQIINLKNEIIYLISKLDENK